MELYIERGDHTDGVEKGTSVINQLRYPHRTYTAWPMTDSGGNIEWSTGYQGIGRQHVVQGGGD